VNQSDDVVERAHNKEEAKDADKQPPDLTSAPQSLPSSRLWNPKQGLGAKTGCHQVHAITQGLEIMAGELSFCYREYAGVISGGYHGGRGERVGVYCRRWSKNGRDTFWRLAISIYVNARENYQTQWVTIAGVNLLTVASQ
jgi:hypothetical protein